MYFKISFISLLFLCIFITNNSKVYAFFGNEIKNEQIIEDNIDVEEEDYEEKVLRARLFMDSLVLQEFNVNQNLLNDKTIDLFECHLN